MELLGYVLAVFGLFVFIKGIKPTVEFINKTNEKELAKGIGFIAIVLTFAFYIFVSISYLMTY